MDKQVQHEFWEAFEDSPFIMIKLQGAAGHAEPMTAQLDKSARHAVWFFLPRGNRIAAGGKAMGHVATKGHDVFACIDGTLVEETDRARREKHWDNAAEAWFPNGLDDPNVLMLRFEIQDAEVWTADPSLRGKFHLLTGTQISPDQAGKHAVGAV
ncbi:MAG TPA: pyridoxamine 5'-phosphate oxidase family protein [Novosphingobium sp.]|nr:pyridoxamine 5'-phosphate oxidase family protein [Novosphingobium sp.]